jgi:adenine-specific DNA-methyltransferase
MEPLLQQKVTLESIDACIDRLRDTYLALPDEDRAKMSEQDVRDYFVTPLLEALGWGTVDPRERVAERYLPRRGFSDYELCLPIGSKPADKYVPILYVEAKKFGELSALQTDLFGYEKRSEADLQAIKYADEYNPKRGEKIGWAIVTNFELFRLWDTRRGVLVESTEWFNEFKRDRTLRILYLLSRDRVLQDPGLLELSSFRSLPEIDEKFLSKLNEWRENLATSIWKYEANRQRLGTSISEQESNLRDVVQRTLDRLIVIRTAEDRGLVPSPYRLQEMVKNYGREGAVPLMLLKNIQNNTFQYFDHHYNSKLFGAHLADSMEVHNNPLAGIIDEMCKASFASMNADILGTTYEQYLGQTIEIDSKSDSPKLVPNLRTRAAQGSYYTPRRIVQRIVDHTVGRYLYGTDNGQPQGRPLPGETRKTIGQIQAMSLLDPACGSGSFLIYSFDVLRDFYKAERQRIEHEMESRIREIVESGVPRLAAEASHDPEILKLRSEMELTRYMSSEIVERHLYGVDLDPQAAEVSAMNLLLKALVRDERLPRILDQNIKVGNSLISGISLTADLDALTPQIEQLASIRADIRAATLRANRNDHNRGGEEETIDHLERDFRKIAADLNKMLNEPLRRDGLKGWFDNPESKSPFNWQVEFPEIFSSTRNEKGFTFVLGNPPYVGFHGFAADKPFLRKTYATASGKFDIYVPFIERGIGLTASRGKLSFICPSTFMKRGFGRKMRRFLLSESSIESIHDFLHTKIFRDALNYTCICVFRRQRLTNSSEITYSEGDLNAVAEPYPQAKLSDSPWVFRFGKEEKLVERIRSNQALVDMGKPEITAGISEGIVTGKNSVLLIHQDEIAKLKLEPDFLRKCLRGADVKRYCPDWGGFYLIYPYVNNEGRTEVVSEQEIRSRCPKLHSYLMKNRRLLESRTYLESGNRDWYEIWCPRDITQHARDKIVVPELADRSQFAFTTGEFSYVDTTCGITLSDECPFDLGYLLAVLNSSPAEYLYRKTTVPKANGFLIYKTMFLRTLPIPVPEGPRQTKIASTISSLAFKVQSYNEQITELARQFRRHLEATVPLFDTDQQSFRSDYYDVPNYWTNRQLLAPDALDLTEPVTRIKIDNEIAANHGTFSADSQLIVSYQSEKLGPWKKLIALEPISQDFKLFVLLASRQYLTENQGKRLWKLPGRKASDRTIDIVLGSLVLPVWGLLHGRSDRVTLNLSKVAELMSGFKDEISGELNPSVIEAERNSLDCQIDDLVFGLYGFDKNEKEFSFRR